jgi:hypothetical protein
MIPHIFTLIPSRIANRIPPPQQMREQRFFVTENDEQFPHQAKAQMRQDAPDSLGASGFSA